MYLYIYLPTYLVIYRLYSGATTDVYGSIVYKYKYKYERYDGRNLEKLKSFYKIINLRQPCVPKYSRAHTRNRITSTQPERPDLPTPSITTISNHPPHHCAQPKNMTYTSDVDATGWLVCVCVVRFGLTIWQSRCGIWGKVLCILWPENEMAGLFETCCPCERTDDGGDVALWILIWPNMIWYDAVRVGLFNGSFVRVGIP